MTDLKKIKEQVNALLDLQGEEQITKAGEIVAQIDAVSTERDALLTEKAELTQKYREAVMNAHLPANNSNDEQGGATNTGKSWEQVVSDFYANKK